MHVLARVTYEAFVYPCKCARLLQLCVCVCVYVYFELAAFALFVHLPLSPFPRRFIVS